MRRLTLALLISLAARAVAAESLLGPDGTTYELRSHLVGANSELVLEIAQPSGSVLVEVVPGTEGFDEERNGTLVFDDRSGSLIAVWEQRVHGVLSQLLLAQRAGDGVWTEPLELSGNPFAERASLRVSVDAGRPGLVTPGEDGPRRRQLISLLWAEVAGPGLRIMLSPVALLDGDYPGSNPSLPLTGFGTNPSPETAALASNPALAKANEPETIALAFLDPETERYQRVLVRALPLALSIFADKARAEIIELGAHVSPSSRPEFADKARAEIIELGSNVHQSLQVFAANSVKASLLADPESDLEILADKARAEIIELGARALDPLPGREGTFVAVPVGTASGGDFELIWHSELDRPPVPPGATILQTLVSPTGIMAAVAWSLDGVDYFSEGGDGGWSSATLLPSESRGREAALLLIADRLAHH